MRSVEGYGLPVPMTKLEADRGLALPAGNVWRDHGALENVEGMRPRYRLDATLFVFEPAGGQRVYEHALTQTYEVRLDGSQLLSGRERREKFKLFAGRLLTGLPTRRVR